MDLSEAVAAWGTPEFKSELEEHLGQNRSEFDFDEFCTSGGGADDDWCEFVVYSFIEQGGTIDAKCSVDFTEMIPGACPDLPNPEKRRASFLLRIDKATGETEIKPDFESRFEPGEYY